MGWQAKSLDHKSKAYAQEESTKVHAIYDIEICKPPILHGVLNDGRHSDGVDLGERKLEVPQCTKVVDRLNGDVERIETVRALDGVRVCEELLQTKTNKTKSYLAWWSVNTKNDSIATLLDIIELTCKLKK